MPIRLACPTLCALALTAAWWASPSAHVPVTGRIVGSVTLVSPDGAPLQSGAYPSRRVMRPAPPPSELANVGENVTAIAVTPGGTARVTFVLPIDVR